MNANVDFLRHSGPPSIGWLLLAIGLVSVAGVIELDQRWTIEREARLHQREAAAVEVERAHRASLRKAPSTPDELRIQGIVPKLREPWLPTLRLVEHVTTAPVYLLGLSIDPAAGAVRLDGETDTFDHVIVYMQDLNQDALLGPSQLRSHEVVTDAAGHQVIRFSIATHWNTP